MAEVGRLKIGYEYLQQTEGMAHEFVTYLAANAVRLGDHLSIGFYLRDGMDQIATDFLDRSETSLQGENEIRAWIDTLPWSKVE